jgi:hypothetical protein
MSETTKKILRLVWTAVLVVAAIRVAAWLLTPALPLLLALAVIGLVLYIAVNGRRGL